MQAIQLSAVIATAVGAIIALFAAFGTTVANHYFTQLRDRRQLEAERETQRRELLRSKLEELINDLIGHVTELEQLQMVPWPLAATLAVGSAMPWKFDEEKLGATPFIKAQTIGALYFPELIDDIVAVGSRSIHMRSCVNEAIRDLRNDPEGWLEKSGDEFNKASNAFMVSYQDALSDLLLKARGKLEKEYL